MVSLSLSSIHPVHTIPSPPYRRIQRRNKVRHNSIRIIQPRKNSYDIRARIRVLLRECGIEEDCQGLSGKRMEKRRCVCVGGWHGYLEGDFVGGRAGLLDAEDGLPEELLAMRLLVQHLVRRYRTEYALKAGGVGAVEEEFLPEAGG